jgi:hypothetical protein
MLADYSGGQIRRIVENVILIIFSLINSIMGVEGLKK